MKVRSSEFVTRAVVTAVVTVSFAAPGAIAAPGVPQPVFERDVLPIFEANCIRCHGPKLKMAHMDLSTYDHVLKGSESGEVVIPGKPSESRLYQKIQKGLMPADKKDALSSEQIELVRKWIEAGAPTLAAQGRSKSEELGEHDVLPLMWMHCTPCHGAHIREAGLDLRTRASMLKGGKSGPAIVPGKPEESLLVRRIRSGDMPPPKRVLEAGVALMTALETDRLQKWIAQGAPAGHVQPDVAGIEPDPLITAKDREFWAFRPPAVVEIPKVNGGESLRNPIDAFILSKLQENKLSFSTEADRLTLLRRACFDITGLPPEAAEARAFLADSSPDAYEKMLDRLLASPRYGERWARYWLDLAGYADHNHAYRYRDYVIRSFNSDKPYDRFLHEQIAGDELVNLEEAPVITQEMMDNLVATGFLRMAPDPTRERLTNLVPDRLQVIADEIDIFSSTVLGLTIKCARCHTHKYDPIPHRDYYRLMDVFKGAYDLYDWLQPYKADDATRPVLPLGNRMLPHITPHSNPIQLAEEEKRRVAENQRLSGEIKQLQAELNKQAEPLKKKLLDERLSLLPGVLHDDLRQTANTPPDKRTEVQKYLAERFEKILKIEPEELEEADADYKLAAEKIGSRVRALQARQVPEPKIIALWDRGEPSPTYILKRGDPLTPGDLVGPGVPSILTDGKTPFEVQPPWPGAKKTGRRLALARWLTRPDHPLTARVIVNRIWEHHFGRGIVSTPGDFGRTGALPTHPELLDWLAREFVRQGWSMKAMHRLIMTSAAYRQASLVTPLHEKADPENLLLSRMPMRRMDAETLYDSMLFVSGRLDEARFGPADPLLTRKDGLIVPAEGEKGWRRAIYMKQVPFQIATLLDSFDYPQMTPNCIERGKSNVATQALHLMNDSMIRKLADVFAERVASEAGDDPGRQVDQVYLTALSRRPTAEQKKISLDALARLEKQWSHTNPLPSDSRRRALSTYCLMILNSAAFLYVD